MLFASHAFVAMRRSLLVSVCRGALGLALVALTSSSGLAQTYYVSNASPCAATPDGSELAPYCTILAATTAHKGPGVTIVVKPGIYREQVTVPLSGVAGSPFVFRASGPGAVIECADDFANAALWTQAEGTSWLASSATVAPLQVFASGGRLAVTLELGSTMPVNTFHFEPGVGLYVNLGGDSPALRGVLVGKRNYGFNMSTKSFITVDGFEIRHAESRGIYMQNPTSDIVISNNTVSFSNSYGIQTINGQRNVITGNKVSDGNFHGIGLTAGASGCVVSNNESFRNADLAVRRANGIFLSAAPANTMFGNNLHNNQDTGLHWSLGSNNCVSYHNRSWSNGDHGFDHLATTGTMHRNDIAYGNFKDGFSFEGDSPGASVYNCIGVNNGITVTNGVAANGKDLWVDGNSSVGFVSDHNIFWNSTLQPPVKWIDTSYNTLAEFQAVSGLDLHSFQANPIFLSPITGDFAIGSGSPAIDAAHSGVSNWPGVDIFGTAPLDDSRTLNRSEGPIAYADIGVFEFLPLDSPPVVVAPTDINALFGTMVSFKVTAKDPDNDPITSLTVDKSKLPSGALVSFVTNSTKTEGTFTWLLGLMPTGNYKVTFKAANALSATASTNIHVRSRVRAMSGVPGDLAIGKLALSDGYPNPSMGAVDFALDLPEDSDLDWSVYDAQGRRVYSESRPVAAGHHQLRWDGMTMSRQRAGTGIYFIRARVGESDFVRRVVRF